MFLYEQRHKETEWKLLIHSGGERKGKSEGNRGV
jgi:hypothetical protein